MTDEMAPGAGPLATEYEILGELRGIGDATEYRAKRRSDGREVLIRVWSGSTLKLREGLPQLAADANLLSTIRHPAVAPVLASKWLDDDRLAVVYEYASLPTLEEQVDRGEELSFPRLAAILRGVNGALEWARDQKIVHRGVTPESMFLEPASDRVVVTFVNGLMPVGGVGDPTTDARTLAALAWEVFTRSEKAVEGETLADMRPDLPKRLVDQTERLRQAARAEAGLPDAETYVATIAMAEALKQVETEAAETEYALRSEERSVREQLETERREHERKITEEREKFAAERAALLAAVTKERDALQAAAAKEREELAAAAAREHEELTRAIQRERDELAKLRDDLERSVIREREQLSAMRQEMLDAGLEPPEGLGLVAPALVLPKVPSFGRTAKRSDILEVPETVKDTAAVTAEETARVAGPPPTKRTPLPFPAARRAVASDEAIVAESGDTVVEERRPNRRRTLWAVGAGALVVAGVATTLVLRDHDAGRAATSTTLVTRPPVAAAPLTAAAPTTVDSAAGAIANDSVSRDSTVRDSAFIADSIAAARAAARERARRRAADSVAAAREAARRDSAAAYADPFALPPSTQPRSAPATRPRDTTAIVPGALPKPHVTPHDSTAAKRDSSRARRDSSSPPPG